MKALSTYRMKHVSHRAKPGALNQNGRSGSQILGLIPCTLVLQDPSLLMRSRLDIKHSLWVVVSGRLRKEATASLKLCQRSCDKVRTVCARGAAAYPVVTSASPDRLRIADNMQHTLRTLQTITTIMIVWLNCNLQRSSTFWDRQYSIGTFASSHESACWTAELTSQGWVEYVAGHIHVPAYVSSCPVSVAWSKLVEFIGFADVTASMLLLSKIREF